MDTALRLAYEIIRSLLIFISAILHFSSLMLCTLLFSVRKLREACDNYFEMTPEDVLHDHKRA
jgi:hypothetical protein